MFYYHLILFLFYFLSGKLVNHNTDVLCDVLILADKYGIDDLKDLSERLLENMLNSENAFSILLLSDRYQVRLLI